MMNGTKSILTIAALALGAAVWTIPGSARADLVGPLAECSQVTEPAALSTCATEQDPLSFGNVVIDDEGNLDVVLAGAGQSDTYDVIFRSVDGSTFSLGSLSTGKNGNSGHFKYADLRFGKNAAGFVVLQRSGVSGDQYVASLFVRPAESMSTRASFHVDLMACGAVNDPKAITGCGTDSFKSGSVDVRSDTGDVTVQVNGAEVGATYNVALRSPNGGAMLSLGSVGPTNGSGDATATMTTVPASTIAAGTVVLINANSSDTGDQAYGGVRVSQKEPKLPVAGERLIKCNSINFPTTSTALDAGADCGTDPLAGGSVVIGATGKLTVSVSGAATSATYEVFFRPVEYTSTGDMDLGIALTTDSKGDGKAVGSPFSSGDIGAGTFVLKSTGADADLDEFFSGFQIK